MEIKLKMLFGCKFNPFKTEYKKTLDNNFSLEVMKKNCTFIFNKLGIIYLIVHITRNNRE